MIKTQKKFSSILEELANITKECGVSGEQVNQLKGAVDTMILPIAVVGEFSAGKSTLLNSFIGKEILSTNIKPETAIATEIYYSEREYTEGVKKDGTVVTLNSDTFNSNDFMYIRKYVNSDNVRKLEPLVLVDMPGFDSPKDAHNNAIISYLEKAVHYIVLTPVDSGTVTASMKRQIQNIQEFNKELSFFVTKTDLRSEKEVDEVVGELKKSISSILGFEHEIYKISNKDDNVFLKLVNDFNPEKLFNHAFNDSMKDIFYEVKALINTKISSLKKTEDQNQDVIQGLQRACEKIEKKKSELIREKQNYSYDMEAESVSSAVASKLHEELDYLSDLAMSSGESALKREINDIAQTVVMSKINIVMEEINVDIASSFSNELEDLKVTFEGLNNTGYIDTIRNRASTWYNSSRLQIDSYIKERKALEAADVAYKTVTGVLAATTTIFSPIIEVAIIFLPNIIKMISDGLFKTRQKENIKQGLIEKIPEVKSQIRTKVRTVWQEQTKKIIEKISSEFDEALNIKKEEIEKVKKEQEANIDIPKTVELLNLSLEKIKKFESEIYAM